uniref:FTH domain-containing protein n=1 Tax=Steinernema glaseri TaxID=37863 RepID=A0A1I7Y059_9BILA
MDKVPYKFVDSVVELFDGEETLDPLFYEVTHPLWKRVLDVHHRNREYYNVYFRKKDSGIQFVAQKQGTEIYEDLGPIQKNRRFARIVRVEDQTGCLNDPLWEGAKTLREVDAAKQLERIAPQLEQSSRILVGDLRCQDIMLSSLSNMVFGGISLIIDGQKSLTFLEHQITNSPFLDFIALHEGDEDGNRWPQFVVPLLEQFCLKRSPGRHVYLDIRNAFEAKIKMNLIHRLFEHWKEKGTLNLTLPLSDVEDYPTPLKNGAVTELEPDTFWSVIRHESAKSIAVCYTGAHMDSLLEFRTCTCDLSEDCLLKEYYPEYHKF